MSKRDFQVYICRPFCCFYRPGEKEELACQGALVLERLAAGGVIQPDLLPDGVEKHTGLWRGDDPFLETQVCGPCPFREDGCDFRAVVRVDDAEPCGGYILLRILRERGGLPDKAFLEACRG
jgi:hypothetical protein